MRTQVCRRPLRLPICEVFLLPVVYVYTGGGQYSIDMLTHGKLHLSEGMLFLVSALAYKDLLFITSLTQRLPTAALCCNHCPVHDKIYLFTMLAQGVAVFFSTIDH